MKIIITAVFEKEGIDRLREAHEVDYMPKITQEELKRVVGQYDALLGRGTCPVGKDIIDAGSSLRVIATAGVGMNHIDVPYARSKGIQVINAAGANAYSVAELTICMMLNLLRYVPRATYDIKEKGIYNKSLYMGHEAEGKTLALIGIGAIGFKVARVCQAMEMKVIAYDPYIKPEVAEEAGIELVGLEGIFRRGDVVSVHVPLTDETRGMISRANIALMKDGAYIMNMSRGEIADEEAVADALETGKLAAYGTDVINNEPNPGEKIAPSRLLKEPNLVITPHIGAWTKEAQEKAAMFIANRLIETLK